MTVDHYTGNTVGTMHHEIVLFDYQFEQYGGAILAGSAVHGYKDGARREALFGYLGRIQQTSNGDYIVADASNCRLRRYTRRGRVTTIAAGGKSATVDGLVMGAHFEKPRARVYSLDAKSHIRIMTPDGYVRILTSSCSIYDSGICGDHLIFTDMFNGVCSVEV